MNFNSSLNIAFKSYMKLSSGFEWLEFRLGLSFFRDYFNNNNYFYMLLLRMKEIVMASMVSRWATSMDSWES